MIPRQGDVNGDRQLFALLRAAGDVRWSGALIFEDRATLLLAEGQLYSVQFNGLMDMADLLVTARVVRPVEVDVVRDQLSGVIFPRWTAAATAGLSQLAVQAAARRLVEDAVVQLCRVGRVEYRLERSDVDGSALHVAWPVQEVIAAASAALQLSALRPVEAPPSRVLVGQGAGAHRPGGPVPALAAANGGGTAVARSAGTLAATITAPPAADLNTRATPANPAALADWRSPIRPALRRPAGADPSPAPDEAAASVVPSDASRLGGREAVPADTPRKAALRRLMGAIRRL